MIEINEMEMLTRLKNRAPVYAAHEKTSKHLVNWVVYDYGQPAKLNTDAGTWVNEKLKFWKPGTLYRSIEKILDDFSISDAAGLGKIRSLMEINEKALKNITTEE